MDERRGRMVIVVLLGVALFVAGVVLFATHTSSGAGRTIAPIGLLVVVVAVFMWRFDGLLDGVSTKRSQRLRVLDEYVLPVNRSKFLAIAVVWAVGQTLWLGLGRGDWVFAVVTAQGLNRFDREEAVNALDTVRQAVTRLGR